MKIESGNTKTAYDKLDKIAAILGVDKWEILAHNEVVQFVENKM